MGQTSLRLHCVIIPWKDVASIVRMVTSVNDRLILHLKYKTVENINQYKL